MKNQPKGKEVTAEQANDCIKAYGKISKVLRTTFNGPGTLTTDSDASDFINKQYNAFVFDKAMVDRFFTGENKADVLMVILGAQPKSDAMASFEKNDPTIVLVGCTSSGEKLFSLPIAFPASEHPPRQVVAEIPPAPFQGTPLIEFSFL